MVTLKFGPNADPKRLTDYSADVLRDIASAAGLTSLLITSLFRTPREQARIMFDNLQRHGVRHQRQLYGPKGDQIIDVYEQRRAAGDGRDQVVMAMAERILALGPSSVSKHCADPKVLNVVDVAPSSTAHRDGAFRRAVMADKRVSRYLGPPGDPAHHLEIRQPQVS